MPDRPNVDVHGIFDKAYRSAQQSSSCPICDQPYTAGSDLWEHSKLAHPDHPDIANLDDEAEAKRRFLERAQKRAIDSPSKRTVHRTSATRDLERNRRSEHNPSKSSQGNQRDESRRHELANTTSKEHQLREEDANFIKKKGGRIKDPSGSPEPPPGSYKPNSWPDRGRHSEQLFIGHKNTITPDVGGQQNVPDKDFPREQLGPKKPLYDPHKDTISGQVFGKDHEESASRAGNRTRPLLEDSSPHGRLNFINMKGTQPEQKLSQHRSLPQQTFHNLNEKGTEHVQRDQGTSAGGSPLLDDNAEPEMLLQPETRPISHDQLVIEVKGIYAGLVMVEAKCIDIDEKQAAAAQEKDLSKKVQLKNDQWQSLIALHKQLLHEHHDFFLASQHPAASPALSRLAAKYSMPARMWRHGIHAFLEVLRYRLPDSLEHMLAFIYIAYSMMALLFETVPTFEDTWIECLGDLGRYRMAIEDDEPRDRETWSNVAKFWYNKAADKSPTVGRLYHHLAILARPYSLEQLSLYTRALTCVTPFESARGSVMTLFKPVLQGTDAANRRSLPLETIFIRAHGHLFTMHHPGANDQFFAAVHELEKDGSYDKYIAKSGAKFKEAGVYCADANIAALFEYGTPKQGRSRAILRLVYEDARCIREEKSKFENDQTVKPQGGVTPESDFKTPVGLPNPEIEALVMAEDPSLAAFMAHASRLTTSILNASLKRPKDRNVYPLVNYYLAFFWSLLLVQESSRYFEKATVWKIVERDIPWRALCRFLNDLASEIPFMTQRILAKAFPQTESEKSRPLLEDFVLRGQQYAQWLFPPGWFTETIVEDDERTHDPPSMTQYRVERILWFGHRIASTDRWIRFDLTTQRFEVTEYISAMFSLRTETFPTSQDEDSIMTYDERPDIYTPRTESIALSDSHDSVTEYTPQSESLAPSESNDEPGCVSTPMDFVDSDAAPHSIASEDVQFGETGEDSPMMDAGPTKEQHTVTGFPRQGQPRILNQAQGGFSPSKLSPTLAMAQGDGYLPSREQIEGLAIDKHRDDAETYKP